MLGARWAIWRMGPTLDLLVIDYGGTARWHRFLARPELLMARTGAEEHPRRPLVLWTPYTGRAYAEVCDEFTELGNVLVRGYENEAEFATQLKAWLDAELLVGEETARAAIGVGS